MLNLLLIWLHCKIFFLICMAQLKPQQDNEISKPLYIRELLGVLWFFYRKVVFNESNIQMVNY